MSKVIVINKSIDKPFLGGWRQRATGIEYFNAESQTGPPLKKVPWDQMCSHQVQVVETVTQNVQTFCDHGTQMWRPDHYVPCFMDKIHSAKDYLTYAEIFVLNDRCARIIQRNYKVYRMRQCIKDCAAEYRRILEECTKRRQEEKDVLRRRHKQEIIDQMLPQTRANFDALYELIENWHAEQSGQLKNYTRSCRCATKRCLILDKNVKLSNEVGKRRQSIKTAAVKRARLSILRKNCKPVWWKGYKGLVIELITLRTQLAREYHALYNAAVREIVTTKERIDILCWMKNSLGIHHCQPVNNLMYLLDQEIMLLYAGIQPSDLKHLRDRIISNFERLHHVTSIYFKLLFF